jgi:hypothetical protein
MRTTRVSSARGWAFALCFGVVAASGCRQILGVEDPVPCESSAECAVEGEPCVSGECVDGGCVYSQVAAGSPAAGDTPGDCSQTVCDESGATTTTLDADDVPADDTAGDCKAPACDESGEPTTAPDESDAPDDDVAGDCKVPVCNNGTVTIEVAETDVPPDTTPDDCRIPACDPDGNVIEIDDPAGCTCEVGDEQPCYDGPVGTDKNSPCEAGIATCEGKSGFGECIGQVLPAPDSCFTTSVDEDCSGDNNECVGEHVWSHSFTGPSDSGSTESVFLPSNDPFGGDVLVGVGFMDSVDIDGTVLTGADPALFETELVRITRQGDVTAGPKFQAQLESLTSDGTLIYVGGTVAEGASENFGGGDPIEPDDDAQGVVAAFSAEDLSLVWKQTISSVGDDSVSHVVPRIGGGVFVQGKVRGLAIFESGGTIYPPLSTVDEFMVAYSATGAVEWVTRWPGSSFGVADVVVDPVAGDVWVCGSSNAALEVTNPAGMATLLHADPATIDGWLFRIGGSTGNVSTAFGAILKLAGAGNERCNAVEFLPGGGRVIAGAVSQTIMVGGLTLTHSDTVADEFVMTMTSSNTPVAVQMFDTTAGSVNIESIAVASDGSIVAGGYFQGGSLQIGTAAPIDAPSGRSDIFVTKFSPTLGELSAADWPRHYFGTGNVILTRLKVSRDFGIIGSGVMQSSFSVGGANLPYDAEFDAFAFKITQ